MLFREREAVVRIHVVLAPQILCTGGIKRDATLIHRLIRQAGVVHVAGVYPGVSGHETTIVTGACIASG
ncbi:hypothetical protein D3C85_1149050 [compost metagenome]